MGVDRVKKYQMSESMPVMILLTLAGGFQDAYSYNVRHHVFANAQTGNIVLLAENLALGDWQHSLHYLWPILAFVFGVYGSEWLRGKANERYLHWRQWVIAMEVVLLIIVGWLPDQMSDLANVMMSFACAMQVNSFRKLHGQGIATTMCIGNMRSATELLAKYQQKKDVEILIKSLKYYMIIIVFAFGAALGAVCSFKYGIKAIMIAAIILLIAFLCMFFFKKESFNQ